MTTEASRHPLAALAGRRLNVVGVLGLLFVAALALWLVVNLIKTPGDFGRVPAVGPKRDP